MKIYSCTNAASDTIQSIFRYISFLIFLFLRWRLLSSDIESSPSHNEWGRAYYCEIRHYTLRHTVCMHSRVTTSHGVSHLSLPGQVLLLRLQFKLTSVELLLHITDFLIVVQTQPRHVCLQRDDLVLLLLVDTAINIINHSWTIFVTVRNIECKLALVMLE